MKKVSAMILLLYVLAQGIFAEMSAEYDSSRLSIEYKAGHLFAKWAQYDGGDVFYTRWRAFQGFVRLREAEFFEIAGYAYGAKKARRFHLFNAVLAGTSVAATAILWDTWSPSLGSSIAFALAAIVPMAILLVRGGNWAPLQQAHAVAEVYNQQLLAELK